LGAGRRSRLALLALTALVALLFSPLAVADQAESEVRGAQQGQIAAGDLHTCAVTSGGDVRCWGDGAYGRLGYANSTDIGDNESPDSIGVVYLGPGRTATAITAGNAHTCTLLDDGSVRCWGLGSSGRLGYGNTASIGDTETPGSVAPVDLGVGRTARAITAGNAHTCAVLDDGSVRCWGLGTSGRLGYGNTATIGDDETPASVAPVYLGAGRTAKAITAGDAHTCALLDDGSVRCWGLGTSGRLGYGNTVTVGDDETPGSVVPVFLGAGRTARAISAGDSHTCAVLDDATLRCWGDGADGRLGYGNTATIGDDEFPGSRPPVGLGAGRSAVSVSAGGSHTCAVLDNATLRCWGDGANGRLGYGNTASIGDDEQPQTVGGVDLGAGRGARAVSAGLAHSCATLDDGSVRCWGNGAFGRLGYGNTTSIGDDETPGAAGAVPLGGPIGAPISDLSLILEPSAPSVMVGDRVLLRTAVVNAGPDAASGVAVRVRPPSPTRLAGAEANVGIYDPDTALWTIGAVPSGASATLVLVLDTLAPADVKAFAEVAASSGLDPDSTPGGGGAEDDRATATFRITARAAQAEMPTPAVAPPTPAPGRRVVRGTAGPDLLRGSARGDILLGLGGADRLLGRAGADLLKGGGGSDRIVAGSGNDIVYGGSGNDRLAGGAGRDRLHGGAGNDTVYGGAGNDRLVGNAGRDDIRGGPGADIILVRDGQRDLVWCGPGRDRVVADRQDVLRGCEVVTRGARP
jgi:alpha-tubulin suppressor-like RCC1 family protein